MHSEFSSSVRYHDQRHLARLALVITCIAIATGVSSSTARATSIVFSTAGNGNVPGVGAFQDEDLLHWDGTKYTLFFDGTANNLNAALEDIDAVDRFGKGFIFSLASTGNVPGVGAIQDEDLIQWDGTKYSLFFDATANGLGAGVDIDAVSIISKTSFIFSLSSNFAIPGLGITQDEDLIKWDGTKYTLFFDGTANGLATGDTEDIDAVDLIKGGFVFSTRGGGTVPGLGAFQDEDLIRWDGTKYSLFFDGTANNLDATGEDIDAVSIPEPSTFGLVASGLLLPVAVRRFRRFRRVPA